MIYLILAFIALMVLCGVAGEVVYPAQKEKDKKDVLWKIENKKTGRFPN